MSETHTTIEALDDGRWRVHATARLAGASADGEAIARQAERPEKEAPAARLAASRAWAALCQARLDAGDFEAAAACARSGIAALGARYADVRAEDDTSLKLAAAEDQIERGSLENGATTLLRVLRARGELFQDLHRATIA